MRKKRKIAKIMVFGCSIKWWCCLFVQNVHAHKRKTYISALADGNWFNWESLLHISFVKSENLTFGHSEIFLLQNEIQWVRINDKQKAHGHSVDASKLPTLVSIAVSTIVRDKRVEAETVSGRQWCGQRSKLSKS